MSPSQHDTPPVEPALAAEAAPQPDTGVPVESTNRKIRYTPTALVPLVIGAIAAIPFAAALGSWGLLIAVPFMLIAIWVLRVGLDIAPEDVRVRGVLGSLKISRSDLVGFTVDKKHINLVRTDGSTVRIPTVRPRDLPMLREALFPGSTPTAPDEPT